MSISRRRFLSWVGAANLALIPGKNKFASTVQHFEGYPDSGGVLFDSTLCIGCRKCESACNEVNQLPDPDTPFDDLSVLDEKRRTSATTFTVVNAYQNPAESPEPGFIKTQCNHCLEPACAAVCFVKALRKTPTGAVEYDASLCVGCRYCMIACPFEIPAYEYDNASSPRIRKCTLCQPRLEEGLLPGCVESCPSGALAFGTRDDLLAIARDRIKRKPDRYIDHIYGETEMGGASWLYLSDVPFGHLGLKEDLGNKPALEFTSGALSTVPIVIGLLPVVLLGAYGMNKRVTKNHQEELEEAVTRSIQQTNELAETKLQAALDKAERAKKKEVDAAVKTALAEANTKNSEDQES